MKTKFKQTGMLISGTLLLSACVGQPNIPKVTEKEVLKYETQYLKEYEKIKQDYKDNTIIKWIQASNKKEPCKMFVGTSIENDRTKDSDYKVFWDGQCKNGYAYGLGREFERGTLTDMEAIAIYSGKKEEPQYYIQKYNLQNVRIEGDLTKGYIVRTIIDDKNMNFNIRYQYGYFSHDKSKPVLITNSSPLNNNISYIKGYPNFAYQILDFQNNEFDNRLWEMDTLNSNHKIHGYSLALFKQKYRKGGEFLNGTMIKEVDIPYNYYQKTMSIWNEIKQAGQKAIQAQNKALLVKKQYKKKICKDNVKVDFIDNDEYKAICHEDEYYAKLKQKIVTKLAQIEKQKQAKRTQQQQERLIQARELEAQAAQRRAAAAETANFNQSMQNFNQNMQMQQLNNNLMMNNLMPKRYDVYIH